jgi:transforming growth factor-beta-induced protein
MRSSFILSFVSIFAVGLATSACSSSDDAAMPANDTGTPTDTAVATDTAPGTDAAVDVPAAKKDLVDTAVGAGTFKTLVAAVQAAGLESTLRGAGPFTVFAPNDDAFKKSVPDFLLTELTSAPYKTELGLILKYHVLSGSVPASAVLGKKQSVDTVAGAKLSVDGTSGKVVINGGPTVTTADIAASNGVIHVIDGVLLPTIVDTAIAYDDGTTKFTTLVTAVKAAELVGTLSGPGTFTVFAPTDKAFADLKKALGDTAFNAILADKAKLTKILTYHVLPAVAYGKDVKTGAVTTVEGGSLTLTAASGKVTIADSTATAANVILTDLPNSNGVIHVIDKVLIPAGL